MSRKSIQDAVIQWDGKPISKPGIYANVGMSAYHGQICVGPSLSSTQIRTGEKRSLKHAYKDWSGNPNRPEPEEKAHFSFGRFVHDMAAQDEASLAENFAIRPEEFDSYRTKAAKAWKAQQWAEGRSCLTPQDVEAAAGLISTLAQHPTVKAGILHGLVEHSIFWIDEETGIWCKARPDVIPVDSGLMIDLKTCRDASPEAARRSIGEYAYHIQGAMGMEGLETLGFPMEQFVLLFIETEDPWGINHKPLPQHDIEYGHRQLRRQLLKWREAFDTGVWPDYEDDEVEGGLPKWYRERLAWEAENGLLPTINPIERQPADEEGIG